MLSRLDQPTSVSRSMMLVMLIRSYGLFWEADEITWNPGRGGRFELLGRRGMNRPGLRIADFRDQRGLYVLYRDYGPY